MRTAQKRNIKSIVNCKSEKMKNCKWSLTALALMVLGSLEEVFLFDLTHTPLHLLIYI